MTQNQPTADQLKYRQYLADYLEAIRSSNALGIGRAICIVNAKRELQEYEDAIGYKHELSNPVSQPPVSEQ